MLRMFKALPRAPYGVLGLGIVLLGLAGLLSREGLVVSFAVFITGCAALPYAYSETKWAAVVPFVVGTALVLIGGVALAGGTPAWYALSVGLAGVASFAYGAAAELPGGRRGDWDQPFKKRPA